MKESSLDVNIFSDLLFSAFGLNSVSVQVSPDLCSRMDLYS